MPKSPLDEHLIGVDRLIKVGQTAAGCAHEINNLLGVQIWHLERLDRELSRVGHRKTQQDICGALDAAHRIRKVARDALTLARPLPKEHAPVDISQVVTDACRLARSSPDLPARLVVDTQLVPPIEGNDIELVQLVLNLILNAFRSFVGTFADHNEVRVRVWRQSDSVCLEVVDNGRGMSPEDKNRAFEAFYTTQAPGEGAGLGLWVCHDITQQHQGSIECESQLGVGTRVVLRLPLAQSDDDLGPPGIGEP